MSAPWVPPHPTYHLRVFVICLAIVVLSLLGFLFGVRMEALVPATGIITARDYQEIRTPLAGLIEPGWYAVELYQPSGAVVRFRLDAQGDGVGEPTNGRSLIVRQYRLPDGRSLRDEARHYHKLQPGDELWTGQVLATLRCDEQRFRLKDLEVRDEELSSTARERLRREKAWLVQQLEQATLRVPAGADLWLAVEVRVAPLQAVAAGDVVAALVPLDSATRTPRDLVARLDIDEKHCAEVEPEQSVRIYSQMHNHRLHGWASARLERLEPWGEAHTEGGRWFRAQAPITEAPFTLPLGSSFKAEIVVGRKTVYRIILEH